MFDETIQSVGKAAGAKAALARRSPLSYLTLAMLAGAYVGIGIVLIFTIGAPLAESRSAFLKPAMGMSFGIALTLVVLAGSELFTGNNMILAVGAIKRMTTWRDLGRVWGLAWLGNLIGSLLLAFMVVHSGSMREAMPFVENVGVGKMWAPAGELFLRAILCNWLVCLAVWMSARARDDTAKCIAIFWCLYAFIACGFEHSVANMTLLGIGVLGAPLNGDLSWIGMLRNLAVTSTGNIVGGALFVGGVYVFCSRPPDGGRDV